MTLIKNRPIIGLALGVALIALALLRLPFAAHADSIPAPARVGDPAARNCPLSEVALDSGYGLTRKELRPSCDR
jgi:hypothetical protein